VSDGRNHFPQESMDDQHLEEFALQPDEYVTQLMACAFWERRSGGDGRRRVPANERQRAKGSQTDGQSSGREHRATDWQRVLEEKAEEIEIEDTEGEEDGEEIEEAEEVDEPSSSSDVRSFHQSPSPVLPQDRRRRSAGREVRKDDKDLRTKRERRKPVQPPPPPPPQPKIFDSHVVPWTRDRWDYTQPPILGRLQDTVLEKPDGTPLEDETGKVYNSCLACCTNRRQMMFWECKHVYFCFECTRKYIRETRENEDEIITIPKEIVRCPICRATITLQMIRPLL